MIYSFPLIVELTHDGSDTPYGGDNGDPGLYASPNGFGEVLHSLHIAQVALRKAIFVSKIY